MKVEVINSAKELEELSPFHVECLLWGTKEIPATYGYMGFVPGDGFYIKMVCEEKDPLRAYENDLDPVYRDSAMEAFFMFESEKERSGLATYLNFEANANGALLAAYGKDRTYRTCFTKEELKGFACEAQILEYRWTIRFRIGIDILEKIYGPLHLQAGSTFTCNFYKISEAKEIEHYASYSPIKTTIPSFHLPEFFAMAEIVERQGRKRKNK